jgi:hypothetical protein
MDMRLITKLSPSYAGPSSSNYISVRMTEIAYLSTFFIIVSANCYTPVHCSSSSYCPTPANYHNSVHSSTSVNFSSAY